MERKVEKKRKNDDWYYAIFREVNFPSKIKYNSVRYRYKY